MYPTTVVDTRYTMDSLDWRQAVQREWSEIVRRLATERAEADGRSLVTTNDFKACAEDAWRVLVTRQLYSAVDQGKD